MKPIAIIQARMTSTRLPGKVLKELAGRTVLDYVVRRCQLSRRLAGVVLATTDEPADDCLCQAAKSLGIEVFRGSREDVLDRYLNAARGCGADPIIRITSDCPLIEPAVIDTVIDSYERTRAEFIYTKGFPQGTGEVELVPFAALQRAWDETSPENPEDTFFREHVITYHWENKEKFPPEIIKAPAEIQQYNYRLCIDEADDYEVIRRICEYFAPRIDFTLAEILDFLGRNPEIAKINRDVVQKTGPNASNIQPPPCSA